MMSDMVERVARAMLAIVKPSWHSSPIRHVDIDESDIDFEELARAAIEAMREPTGEMLTAMRVNLGGTDQLHIDEAEEAWRNGIDAALKEPYPDAISPAQAI